MFNVGGGELLVIFLVALIVLGPAKLPEVARQIGGVMPRSPQASAPASRTRCVPRWTTRSRPPLAIGATRWWPPRSHRPPRPISATNSTTTTTRTTPTTTSSDDRPIEDVAGSTRPRDDEADRSGSGEHRSSGGHVRRRPTATTSTPNPYLAPVGSRAQPTAEPTGQRRGGFRSGRTGRGTRSRPDAAERRRAGRRRRRRRR